MAWTEIFNLEGRSLGMVSLMPAIRERVAQQLDCHTDLVHIEDRYDPEETGDSIEVIVVDGIGDVGVLDRPAPAWFKPKVVPDV